MFTHKTTRARIVPVLGVLAIAAILAACSTGAGAPAPTAVPAPITPAPGTPAPVPSPDVDDPGSDLMPIHVVLESTSGQDVYVDIVDQTGAIDAAVSGQPGDGAIVEPHTVLVENLDARTLRLSWTDFPIDNALGLYVEAAGAGYRMLLVQPAPSEPADAMGEGRVLDLSFDHDVSATQVEAFLQEGLDTPG